MFSRKLVTMEMAPQTTTKTNIEEYLNHYICKCKSKEVHYQWQMQNSCKYKLRVQIALYCKMKIINLKETAKNVLWEKFSITR